MFIPVDKLPDKFVLFLAAPYLAGSNAESALALANQLYREKGLTSTIDVLGEAPSSEEQCENYVQIFMHLVDLVSLKPLNVSDSRQQLTISFKPSMFCAAPVSGELAGKSSLARGYARMEQVVKHAKQNNIAMTLEAEQASWSDYQLQSYFSLLKAGCTNLGTVLQTRLFSTRDNLCLFDHTTRVRLVIGVYQESGQIAYTEKKAMKDLLLTYAGALLARGCYVEMATHDEIYVEKFLEEFHAHKDRFEFQFLFGVPRQKLQESLKDRGYRVRLYLPFGAAESAAYYCKRRLRDNPNLFIYGLKNLLHLQ